METKQLNDPGRTLTYNGSQSCLWYRAWEREEEIAMRKNQWTMGILTVAASLLLTGCQQGAAPEEGTAESAAGGESSSASPAASSTPAKPGARSVTLAAGTPITIRTMNTLSTKVVKSGENFAASLETPIVEGTWVIAPKGANVRGVVVESNPGGRVKGRARMVVELTQIETAGGQKIDIQTGGYSVEAKSSKKEDAKKIGIGSAIGAVIGAVAGGGKGAAKGAAVGAGAGGGAVLATRGDAAVIGAESVLRFELQNPVTITEAK